MKRLQSILRPTLCAALFMSAGTVLLWLAGAGWTAALDGAFSALAGVRPQSVSLGELGIHPGWIAGLYAAGLVVRIFLIAYWAAHLVRAAGERNELKKVRRQLEVRMSSESAESADLPRSFQWN